RRAVASRPASRSRAAACRPRSRSRAPTNTVIPRSPNRRAISKPMPLLAPVTSATGAFGVCADAVMAAILLVSAGQARRRRTIGAWAARAAGRDRGVRDVGALDPAVLEVG